MKKGLKGALKISSIFLILAAVISFAVLNLGVVSANTHSSTVDVTPHIVPNVTSVNFTAHVMWTGGPDPIHEFRVYQPLDFSGLVCYPATGWYDPTYGYTTIGGVEYYYCHWSAKPGNILNAGNPEKNFTFSLNTAETECCRNLFVETRDDHGFYAFHNPGVCIDTSAPITTKSFNGPQKIDPITGAEWIDGITTITLNPVDPEPHPAGVEKTWWYDDVVDDRYCYEPEIYCKPVCPSPYKCECSGPNCVENVQELCKDLGKACNEAWVEMKFGSEAECLQNLIWEDCVEILVNTRCVDCKCDENWQLYRGIPISKENESCHILQFFSVDNVGNIEPMNVNCFFVDKTPPEVEKTVDQLKVEELDLEQLGNGKAAWVTSQYYSGTSSAKLVIPDNAVGTDFAGVDSFFDVFVQLDQITSLSYYRKVTQYDNGWSPIVILGIDADGDGVFEAQPLEWEASLSAGSVDPTLLGDDSFIQCEAVTGLAGLDANFVKVNAYADFKCYTPNVAGDNYDWSVYEPLSYFQSNNVGRVETTDKVAMIKIELGGNPSTQDNEIAYVDKVELNGNVIIDDIDGFTWVSSGTDIEFTCTDQGPHPSKDEQLCFRVSYDKDPDDYNTDIYCGKYNGNMEGEWCCVDATPQLPFVFNFNTKEDSLHDLEYYCRDAVEKESDTYIQYYKVDSTPSNIAKTVIGPQVGQCNPIVDKQCWIKDWKYSEGTTIHVEATDPEVNGCAVDQVKCEWWYYLDGGSKINGEREKIPPFDIKFYDETEHELHIECCDILGNCKEDVETFYVDSSGPTVQKSFIGPYYKEGYVEWIDTATLVELTAKDLPEGVCAVNNNKIYYINTLAKDETGAPTDLPCKNVESCKATHQPNPTGEGWTLYEKPFPKAEESCHILEYYAVDALGNIGPVGVNCFFVDKTKPIVSAKVGDPKIPCDPQDLTGCWYWVRDHVTEVELSCNYGIDEPHPAPLDKIEWRIKIDDGSWGPWQEADANTNPKIVFTEDSVHTLQYKCNDTVGKESDTLEKVFKVDSTPPTTTKTYIPKAYIDPSTGWEYIDTAHEIELTVVDGGDICAVGVDKIQYRVSGALADKFCQNCGNWMNSLRPDMGEWNTYTEPFGIGDESCHVIEYRSIDLLGNTEDIKWQCVFVDKTKPETTKTYVGPQYPEQGYPKWITSATEVHLSASDPGPHPSGVAKTYYRDIYFGDNDKDKWHYCQEDCGTWDPAEPADPKNPSDGWTEWTGIPFYKTPESCHIIEYYSVDNVGKVEDIKWQCVFVDNTAPEPDKKVGEPKEMWTPGENGDPESYYYPEANELCWTLPAEDCTNPETCLQCWTITRLTPVTLDCVDPEPHPVDHEGVCFKVSWDGDDVTQQYCQGDLKDGFCCVDHEIDFLFGKTSEHELEYYCVDALGNKGTKIDKEKFKVEDTPFNITINKKWNLISTPVFLLDDSMDQIFEGLESCVKTVWTYDAVNDKWSIYTPDGNSGNDDLTTMVPGDGYWVLAQDDCVLQIGGSLMRPGPVGQASKEIVPGWNLIGHYGTDGILVYDGPNLAGDGKQAQCALYSLGPDLLDKEFTGLYTYWEPDNPDQWKALNRYNYMNPGAGYWLAVPQGGLYTPSSDCSNIFI